LATTTTPTIDYAKNTIIYPSKELFGILCFPESKKIEQMVMKGIDLGDKLGDSKDFQVTWPIMLASVAIALLLGLIFCFLVKFCAKIIVWLLVIGFNLSFLAVFIICAK